MLVLCRFFPFQYKVRKAFTNDCYHDSAAGIAIVASPSLQAGVIPNSYITKWLAFTGLTISSSANALATEPPVSSS